MASRSAELTGIVRPEIDSAAAERETSRLSELMDEAAKVSPTVDTSGLRRNVERALPAGSLFGDAIDKLTGRGGPTMETAQAGSGGGLGDSSVQVAQLEQLEEIHDVLEKDAVSGGDGGGGGSGVVGGAAGSLAVRGLLGGGVLGGGAAAGGIAGLLGLAGGTAAGAGSAGFAVGVQELIKSQGETGRRIINQRRENQPFGGRWIRTPGNTDREALKSDLDPLGVGEFAGTKIQKQFQDLSIPEPEWLSGGLATGGMREWIKSTGPGQTLQNVGGEVQDIQLETPDWLDEAGAIDFETPDWMDEDGNLGFETPDWLGEDGALDFETPDWLGENGAIDVEVPTSLRDLTGQTNQPNATGNNSGPLNGPLYNGPDPFNLGSRNQNQNQSTDQTRGTPSPEINNTLNLNLSETSIRTEIERAIEEQKQDVVDEAVAEIENLIGGADR